MLVAPIYWCYLVSSTNILVQYKENQNVSSTTPTQLNVAYSISWSEQKRKFNYSKMAANFREKRTSITTMGAKTQAFDIFLTPLISHYPLPLSKGFESGLVFGIRIRIVELHSNSKNSKN
jgi:hypothetical protein